MPTCIHRLHTYLSYKTKNVTVEVFSIYIHIHKQDFNEQANNLERTVTAVITAFLFLRMGKGHSSAIPIRI